VLDTVITVFNRKGDEDLGVPPPPSECPLPPQILPSMGKTEKFKAHKERLALKRRKAEMYSLWCDALYRLSLADHVSDIDKIITSIECCVYSFPYFSCFPT